MLTGQDIKHPRRAAQGVYSSALICIIASCLASSTQKEKRMKRFVLAIAFTCALSATAMAGEIPSTGMTTPAEPETNLVVTLILTIISIVAG